MRTFSYPNSDHAADSAATPAPQRAGEHQDQPRTFSYPNTNQPLPQGAPADAVPDNVRAQREERRRESFYSAQRQYERALPIDPQWPKEAQAVVAELREVMGDLGASEAEAREFAWLAQREPASAEERAAWETEAHDALRDKYGAGAEAALADAQKLAARDFRFLQLLNESGWGSHPKIVLLLADKARTERLRGRL